MALQFFNTLTRSLEPLVPLKDKHIGMYTCGPTVYDYAHIGNFRSFLFEDILRRTLKYFGYSVTQIMNLTDVDDKIIKRSREKGMSPEAFTQKYIDAFFEDLDTLCIERAEKYPRATEHIPEMVELIKTLQGKGFAYEAEGGIFYSIEKFKGYGKLSRMDLSQMKRGERVLTDEYEKEDLRDFCLWKSEKTDDYAWDSEFGRGRPGWHIECSAMSQKYLGETFDIHTGGVDNMFPHHENEIAQSEAATGKPFVRLWMHAEFLLVENKKMSKSLGNFYTLRDLVKKGYDPLAIRYLLFSAHYRKQLNFTLEGLEQAGTIIGRFQDFLKRLDTTPYPKTAAENNAGKKLDTLLEEGRQKFDAAIADDLNTAEALGVMFTLMNEVNALEHHGELSQAGAEKALALFRAFDRIWALEPAASASSDDSWIEEKIEARNAARKAKDFSLADALRDELLSKGIELEDTPHGTRWKKI